MKLNYYIKSGKDLNKLKNKIKSLFNKYIDDMDIDDKAFFAKERLELQLNDLNEKILNNLEFSDSLEEFDNEVYLENVLDKFAIESGKSQDVLIDASFNKDISKELSVKKNNKITSIPDNFILDYDMLHFATSKYIKNPQNLFDDFKLYYQAKGTLNSDWKKAWERWVLQQNKFNSPLEKTLINKDMILTEDMKKVASKYLKNDKIELEFIKFKNHYLASGDIKASWIKTWENWTIKNNQLKSKATSTSQEKSDYRWNFRKAKDVSDRIKEWLKFDKKINWLDDYYWKDIPIPGIGWQKVMHPDFNKEEILLYKVESKDGQFMIEHASDDIIEIEILENE
ncbi:MAG: hypothetical protein U9Q30_09920 [Campylobacterota bacterium]|nr:hypothetical protein [Campylobacterota bacterium]